MQQIGREVEKIESFFKCKPPMIVLVLIYSSYQTVILTAKEAEAESSFLELEGEVKRLVVLSASMALLSIEGWQLDGARPSLLLMVEVKTWNPAEQ